MTNNKQDTPNTGIDEAEQLYIESAAMTLPEFRKAIKSLINSKVEAAAKEASIEAVEHILTLGHAEYIGPHARMVILGDKVGACLADLKGGEGRSVPEQPQAMIMGKTIQEVCTILTALELERITDIEFTQKNLQIFIDKFKEEQRKVMQASFDRATLKGDK